MSKQVQHRRGTTAQHAAFTGAVGEITVDTDKDVVVVHDGATIGGFPQLSQAQLPLRGKSTIAALRALTPTTEYNVLVSGYYTNGDGGGGLFYAVSGGSYTDNGGTIITTGLGVTASSAWLRVVEGSVSVKAFGAKGNGGDDDTSRLQAAFTVLRDVYFPSGTYVVSNTISTLADTKITAHPSAVVSTSLNFQLFSAAGSLTVVGLTMTRPAAAQNTFWKAITLDNGNTTPADSRVIVRDCVITNFDIGVYCDGGTSQKVIYVEVSGCRIVSNPLCTGASVSIIPTINVNNCGLLVVKDNPLLDASDRTNPVNNIYCIGTKRVIVENNYIYSGSVKIIANAANQVDYVGIKNNYIRGIAYTLVGAAGTDTTPPTPSPTDGKPVKQVVIEGNFYDTPVTSVSDTGTIILGSYNYAEVTGADSIEYCTISDNYFKDVPASVYYIALTANNSIGCVSLSNNKYSNTSTASSGTYPVVNYNTNGTAYKELIASNEDVSGNSNTRAYLGGGNPFATTRVNQIIEKSITNPRTGLNSGSFTATLTGCTTSPTGTASYIVQDGMVIITFPSLTATSNSTSCTLTGLPSGLQPASVTSSCFVTGSNNSAVVSDMQVAIAPSSGTMTLYKNGSSTGFTGSGTKGIYASTITYMLS